MKSTPERLREFLERLDVDQAFEDSFARVRVRAGSAGKPVEPGPGPAGRDVTGRSDGAGASAADVANGFYTITFPCGSFRTLRIRTEKHGPFEGKRTIALLIGPVNTTDYQIFGFVTDDGVQVWKRAKNTKDERYAELLWRMATGEEIEGHELVVSKRCLICNRPLTTPKAVERGIGDTCWERMQG